MAVTITNRIGGALRAWKLARGLSVIHAEIAVTSNGDYTAGILITPANFGLRRVFAVQVNSCRVNSDNSVRAFVDQYDQTTGRLRLYRTNTTAALPMLEVTEATPEFDPTTSPMTLSVLVFGV
jgi:hypothetical protein